MDNNWAITFWIRPSIQGSGTREILVKTNQFSIEHRFNDTLRFYLGNVEAVNGSIIDEQRAHIVVNGIKTATPNEWNVSFYINGQLQDSQNVLLPGVPSSTNPLIIGSDEWFGYFDELALWNENLTTSEIANLYNGGNGIKVTDTNPDVVVGYHFDEGVGTETANFKGDSFYNGTLSGTGTTWEDGLVSIGSTSGVVLPAYDPNLEQEQYFTAQIPHSYIEGTDLYPHVHWSRSNENFPGNVVWGFEYTVANVGGVFSDTSVLYSYAPSVTDGDHWISSFPPIDGSSLKISAMLSCRIFRAATDSSDNYIEKAFLLEFDFHYRKNSSGSNMPFVKTNN
jgi:hypothetical protein